MHNCISRNFPRRAERPDTPTHLEIIEVSSRSVTLSWRRPFDGNSPVLSYIVQYRPLLRSSSGMLHHHQQQPHRLHPSVGGGGGGADAAAIAPTDGTQPVIVTTNDEWQSHLTVNLTLPTISSSSSSGGGGTGGNSGNGGVGTLGTVDGNPREQATLGGLHPATTYMVRMLAVNEIERSSFTEPVIIKTREERPAEPPLAVQVLAGGSIGELVVTWQPPLKDTWNGDLIGYTINCTEERQNVNYLGATNETQASRLVRVDGFATTKATVGKLKTFRRYSIGVRAVNGYGAGPWSALVFGTTLEGVPEAPPQHVNCTALSSQSIKIAWTEPALQFHGGVILGYKIVYRPLVQDSEYNNDLMSIVDRRPLLRVHVIFSRSYLCLYLSHLVRRREYDEFMKFCQSRIHVHHCIEYEHYFMHIVIDFTSNQS